MSSGAFIARYIITSAIFQYNFNSITFTKSRYDTYDFIIIGGGTAGSLIANRLSANEKFKVLLLDRGGSPGNYFTEIPYFQNFFSSIPPIINRFQSAKQKSACLSTNGICTFSVGNGLGGGSTHNGFVYVRGSPLDFNQWENEFGATGWSYKDVLPFFKSTETCLNRTLIEESPGLRGTKPGGIFVSTPNDYPTYSELIIAALAEDGQKIGDFNSDVHNQFGIAQVTIGRGVRSSSWNVYLEPVIGRKNLDVISFASVNKINFDGNKRAISVSYRRQGKNFEAMVSKEVIVSAGTIDTPKILMLSGIGDEKRLSKIGVNPIVSNLPSVGQSMQEHSEIIVPLTTGFSSNGNGTYQDFETYQSSKKGRYSTDRHSIVVGFLPDPMKEKEANDENDSRVEYEFVLIDGQHAPIANGTIYPKIYNIHPFSRGSIKLKSIDPKDDPIIDPKFFSDERDIEMYKKGISNLAKFVSKSKVFKEANVRIAKVYVPGCGFLNEQSLVDEDFLDCFIRTNSYPADHLSCSCRMGQPNDPLACVDPQLRVVGIKNVRVMDASVMPQVIRGNTNAPTTMIAEKGSKMVLDTYS